MKKELEFEGDTEVDLTSDSLRVTLKKIPN